MYKVLIYFKAMQKYTPNERISILKEISIHIETTFNLENSINIDKDKDSIINQKFDSDDLISVYLEVLLVYSIQKKIPIENLIAKCNFNKIIPFCTNLKATDPTIDILLNLIDKPDYINIVKLDSIIKDMGINFFSIENQTVCGIKYNTFRSWMTVPSSSRHRKPKQTTWNHLIQGLIDYQSNKA